MFRISLRQLFILVGLIAVAMVSLKYASITWQGIVGLTVMLAMFTAVIVGIFDRGPRRAFAIGFALSVLGYGILIANGKTVVSRGMSINIELDVSDGGPCLVPTTALLRGVYGVVHRTRWIDQTSGKDVPGYDYVKLQVAQTAAETTGTPMTVFPREWPPCETFTIIGHYWWALVFGFVGGQVARFVYVRRTKELAAQSPG